MVRVTLGILLVGLLIAPCAYAVTDYRGMSDEQLQQQRATIGTRSPEEQSAFSEEWYRRYQGQRLEGQARMREERFGMAPGQTTGEMMQQPLPSTEQRPGTAMQQPGMTHQQPGMTQQQMGQPGSMQGSSQADMGASQTYQSRTRTETYTMTRDPRTMSTEELAGVYTSERMGTMSPGEREAMDREWERRLQSMTPEERQRYLLHPRKDTMGAPGQRAGTEDIERQLLQRDYSTLTDRELMETREIISHGTQEQQMSFWREWQRRGIPMTNQERMQYGTR